MGIIGDILSPLVQGVGMYANYKQQEQQFNYDQELQQTMFDREDNAIQRRSADLAAAGLSPTLAAGNAASTMSPIRAQVPGAGIGNQVAENMALRTSLMRQEADIASTKAQKDLLDQQREKIELETLPMKAALASNYEVDVNGDGSVMMKPQEWLGRAWLLNERYKNETLSNQATKSMWDADNSRIGASISDLALKQGQANYDLNLRANLSSLIRDLVGGMDRSKPIGSALGSVLGQIELPVTKVAGPENFYIPGGPKK